MRHFDIYSADFVHPTPKKTEHQPLQSKPFHDTGLFPHTPESIRKPDVF